VNFRSCPIAKDYDKIIKESLKEVIEVIMKRILGINLKSYTALESKLQVTEERKPDFLIKVESENGECSIVHLEFQTTNDKNMINRMLRYFVFIRDTYNLLPIRQVLIYTGKSKLSMVSELKLPMINYHYDLFDMKDIPYEHFLNSNHPAEIILSILCQFEDEDKYLLVRKILKRLKDKISEESLFSKYIKQLEILSSLRDLQAIVIEEESNMALTYDLEKDIRFMQGEEKGEARGEAKGEIKGKLSLLEELFKAGKFTEQEYLILIEPLQKKLDELK